MSARAKPSPARIANVASTGTNAAAPDGRVMAPAAGSNVGLETAPSAGEEAAWVVAARAGDGQAFARLYRVFAPMVHGVLLARVPRDIVDDLVQDVFLLALGKLRSLREPAAFGAWIAVIARNRAMDFHRRSRKVAETIDPLDEEQTGDRGLPSGRDDRTTEAARALEAIRALPEAYRETLMLRLVEGMTGPEIAARTGMTPGSVRVNLHRGMGMLRERLGFRSGSAKHET